MPELMTLQELKEQDNPVGEYKYYKSEQHQPYRIVIFRSSKTGDKLLFRMTIMGSPMSIDVLPETSKFERVK